MKAKREPLWHDITAVSLDGHQYHGKYRVHDATHTGQIDVWCDVGSIQTNLGGFVLQADVFAKSLLLEIHQKKRQ